MPPKHAAPGRPRLLSTDTVVALDAPSTTPGSKGTHNRRGQEATTTAPRLALCRLAVALTQASFVLGSIYLKGSLAWVDTARGEVFNPIVYAFIREICASPILFAISYTINGAAAPTRSDLIKVVALGGSMFASQLFYIKGIQLSGVVVATCMQPTIPVFTVLLGVLFGMETASPRKLAGIGVAVLGAVSMVLGGASTSSQQHHAATGTTTANHNIDATIDSNSSSMNINSTGSNIISTMMLGNMYLAINTLAMACYYLLSKQLVKRYSPFQVAAWAYICAATLMGCAAIGFTTPLDWHFPKAMLLPLLYWVLIGSVAGYVVVTWAVKYLPASQVAAFQCLQPLLGTSLAFVILHEQLSWWDLGALGVLAGLVVVSGEQQKEGVGGAGDGRAGGSGGGKDSNSTVVGKLRQFMRLRRDRDRGRLKGQAAAAREKAKQMPMMKVHHELSDRSLMI